MSAEQKTPADIARRLASRARAHTESVKGCKDTWRRETYTLKRGEAREKSARLFFKVSEGGLYAGLGLYSCLRPWSR